MKDKKNNKQKIPILGKIILIILIIISSLLIILSLGYFWLSYSDDSLYLIFGIILLVPSLIILISSIFTLQRINWARIFLISLLGYTLWIIIAIVIGSVMQKEIKIGIVSTILLLLLLIIIYYFSFNKEIKGVFS